MATSIISNNVGVAFRCFAGGVLFGVGSLIMLGYNGLFLGAISGYYANVGMLGYSDLRHRSRPPRNHRDLHRVCRGFLLGRAVIAPGELSRGDALAVAGRTAMRLVGAAGVMLIVAGSIEGFISSSAWSLPARLAVSGASMLFLIVYLMNGTRRMPVPS